MDSVSFESETDEDVDESAQDSIVEDVDLVIAVIDDPEVEEEIELPDTEHELPAINP
jgi:hypothetical protein